MIAARLTGVRLAALVAAGTLLLTGCASASGSPAPDDSATGHAAAAQPALAELDLVPNPKTYEGPSTAVLVRETITPVAAQPKQSLPTRVVSHDSSGEINVTVTDTARVIALDRAGSIAATVWGLGFGDRLVGRDISTTFPGAEELPVVTSSGHSVNAEAILALNPTLVITDGSIGPRDVLAQLRDANVTVVFVHNEPSLTGAEQLARDVGAAFGATAAGDMLAERIRQQIDDKVAEIAAIAPKRDSDRLRMMFLYLRGTSGIYYLFGEESGADELIEALGGVDIAGELGWEGMRPVTDEALVSANPDLILVMSKGVESAGGIDGLIAAKPAVGLTQAGAHRRFVDMADGDILSFGPRSAAVLDALARAVYAPGQ